MDGTLHCALLYIRQEQTRKKNRREVENNYESGSREFESRWSYQIKQAFTNQKKEPQSEARENPLTFLL